MTILVAASCGPTMLRGPQIAKDAEIEDTPDHRALLAAVEQYRAALEQRDVSALLALASKNYYEDAGTTATDDDYSYDGLVKILKERLPRLKQMRLRIVVDRIRVEGNRAAVDYTYHGRYQVQGTKKTFWKHKSWESRLRFERGPNGRWLIVGGM